MGDYVKTHSKSSKLIKRHIESYVCKVFSNRNDMITLTYTPTLYLQYNKTGIFVIH